MLEKLNLYPLKKKKVNILTVVFVALLMLLPGISLRMVLEWDWKDMMNVISLQYKDIIDKTGYRLRGDKLDITNIRQMASNFKVRAEVFASKQKQAVDFVKKAFVTKSILKSVFNGWRKDEKEWMVLKRLELSQKSFVIDYYDVYKKDEKLFKDYLQEELAKFGKVTTDVVFDVEFLGDLKIQRVVIRLNVYK